MGNGASGPSGLRVSGRALGIVPVAVVGLVLAAEVGAGESVSRGQARVVPTFECLGVYWSPQGGSDSKVGEKTCLVRYRPVGAARKVGTSSRPVGAEKWKQAFPLWFDVRNGEYRGSIVNLQPGTLYEIRLRLIEPGGTETDVRLRARTWSETFPVAKTIALPPFSDKTFEVNKSGRPTGYVLYTHPPNVETSVIDVANRHETCVEINASYVIVRALTLKGAQAHAIRLARGVHDVVIERCDISGWGRVHKDGWGENYDSAIRSSRSKEIERIIIQRNRMHHPRSDSNHWKEYRTHRKTYHPMGPQAICLFNTGGNHVFRYNAVYSDDDHRYNDIFGAGSNFSTEGFPNRDSDIYGNTLSHCWDDAIESEGANCNVRIWGNYLYENFVQIACASTSVGPLYVWRNVTGISRTAPGKVGTGGFFKTSDNKGGGKIYVFHNTILQPPPPKGERRSLGCGQGLGWGGPMVNTTTRNNILHLSGNGRCISDRKHDPQGDYDYDLYSGRIDAAEGYEKHGIRGSPRYDRRNGPGQFALDPSSPGYDAGVVIPNFSDGFTGARPDMGAHEAGTPAMEFGMEAYSKVVRRAEAGRRRPKPPRPRLKRASDEAVARYDAELIRRVSEEVDAGRRVRFSVTAFQQRFEVMSIDEAGTMGLKGAVMKVDLEWPRLELSDRRNLALALLRDGNAAEHCLAAFYLIASGDEAAAEEHLSRGGEGAADVAASFTLPAESGAAPREEAPEPEERRRPKFSLRRGQVRKGRSPEKGPLEEERPGHGGPAELVNLYRDAETYFIDGDFEKARELFERIVRERPESDHAGKAREYLEILK